MKEPVTLRLYELPRTPEAGDTQQYQPAEDVVGWDYEVGDQIGLQERTGGFLMGRIEQVLPEVHEDESGRYKLVILWTQD